MDITKTFVQTPHVKISIRGTVDEMRGFLLTMLNAGIIKPATFDKLEENLQDWCETYFFADERVLVGGLSALALARMDEQTYAKLRLQRRKTKCRHTFDRWLVAQAKRMIRSWKNATQGEVRISEDELATA